MTEDEARAFIKDHYEVLLKIKHPSSDRIDCLCRYCDLCRTYLEGLQQGRAEILEAKEVKDLAEQAEIVCTHPCFGVGTTAYDSLPRGLPIRVKMLEKSLYILRHLAETKGEK